MGGQSLMLATGDDYRTALMYLPSLFFCLDPRFNFFNLPSSHFAACLVQLIHLPTYMFCRLPFTIVLFAYTGTSAIQEGSTSTMDTYLHGWCDRLLLLSTALTFEIGQ